MIPKIKSFLVFSSFLNFRPRSICAGETKQLLAKQIDGDLMDENRFWSMIEAAWTAVGGQDESRKQLAEGRDSENIAYSLDEPLGSFIAALTKQLAELPAAQLLAFDRILERKLYDIDRADIHERTDGSDDGFLYCRGFIVALGRAYYEAVLANPDRAVMDAECEEMCYLSSHLYHERFGKVPPSGISRETRSNSAGWALDAEPDSAAADGGA